MRAVIQRVTQASVSVDGKIVSEIGRGLCVLVGICRDDANEDTEYIIRKILNARLFESPSTGKRWDVSVKDSGFEILCVSQFTLHAVFKGNKLDFHNAMAGDAAKEAYAKFYEKLGAGYDASKIKDGVFGALMQVNIVNDGPVTIDVDSKTRGGSGDK